MENFKRSHSMTHESVLFQNYHYHSFETGTGNKLFFPRYFHPNVINYILNKDMRFKLLFIAILAFSYDFGPGPGNSIENECYHDLTIVWSCVFDFVMAGVITNVHGFHSPTIPE